MLKIAIKYRKGKKPALNASPDIFAIPTGPLRFSAPIFPVIIFPINKSVFTLRLYVSLTDFVKASKIDLLYAAEMPRIGVPASEISVFTKKFFISPFL